MARILIVSSGSPCRNPRPLKEAHALGGAGHDVTLLTVSESPALDAMEAALTAGAAFRHESVGRHRGPVTRLLQRIETRLAVQSTILGWETLRALGPVAALRARVRELPADLTIVHNEIPHWIGCDLLAQGRRVAADFEDWHSEDLMPSDRRGRPLARMREVEQRLLREAAYVSTTSHALSAALAARYGGRPPFVLANAFPLQPDPHVAGAGGPPTFFWFSQTIGPGRGLEEFFAAWRLTTAPSRLALLGNVRARYDRHLLALVPEAFRSRVSFLPLVPPAALPGVIARHDLGLALEDSSITNRDLTITNKVLQYLNAGLAVVASGTTGQREVINRAPGAGILVDLARPPELAAQLDALLADPARLAAIGRAARQAAETTYCWEREAPRLLAQVEAALARPPGDS
jgi:glycosyltransferase involved in cell wall biosynthesis